MKKANERLYGVVGLGIFGSTVAKTLSQNNCEVIAVDGDMKCVNRMADIVTEAMQCDVTDVSQLRVAGLADCDIVFVCMGSHLEESALAIINLKELGVPYIIAKAKNKRFMQVFSELGADKVVRPEKEMGEQVAKSVLGNNIIEIIMHALIVDALSPVNIEKEIRRNIVIIFLNSVFTLSSLNTYIIIPAKSPICNPDTANM